MRFLSASAALTLLSCCAYAQQPNPLAALEKPVELKLEKVSLSDALKALQTQYHISVIADSTPLVKSADIKVKGALREVLDKIGESYDYGWAMTQVGIVVMSKRFTGPQDRPQMNLEEMRHMASELVKALSLLKFDKAENAWGKTIVALAHELLPEQLQKLKDGERLTPKEMSPAQMDLVAQAIANRALAGPTVACERLLAILTTIKSSKLRTSESGVLPDDATLRRLVVQHVGGSEAAPVVTPLGEIDVERKGK